MTTPHDTSAWAQQIAQHHAQLQIGQPLRTAEATLPSDAHLPQAQAAVLQGARMLGFIEADAQCVAKAWQHQTQRLGQFDPLHWPDQAVDFLMPAWPRQNAFAPCPRALGLYAVLPNAEWVARMAQAGVPTLQLRFKSDKPADVAKAMRGMTFNTILGKQTMRKEDNQLEGPNFFGVVTDRGGKLRPVIQTAVPAAQALPAPDPACKLPA